MRHRFQKQTWRGWAGVAGCLAVVVACSDSGKSFFDGAPPVTRAGAGGTAGSSAGRGGTTGGTTDPAGTGDTGAGAEAGGDVGPGTSGGAPDGSGGTGDVSGNAGESSVGGSGAKGGKGGTTGSGGKQNHAGGGGAPGAGSSAGGTAGTGGDLNATGGSSTGGAGLGGFGGGAAGTQAAGSGGKGCTPTDEICDGLDNDCANGIDDHDVCPTGCVGAVYADHHYLLCTLSSGTAKRSTARTACGTRGETLGFAMDLARIGTQGENDFLLGLIADNHYENPVWMAATDSENVDSKEGTWVWQDPDDVFYEDHQPVSNRFNDWGEGQPDNDASGVGEDCAVFDPELDWHWNDRACPTGTPSFVCEEGQ